MSVFFLSFLLLITSIVVSSFFIYRRYRYTSGIFFFIFGVAISLWYLLYFISFDVDFGADIILSIYRFQYSLSFTALYSVLFFVMFFGIQRREIRKKEKMIFGSFLLFFVTVNFSPLILSGVEYDKELGSYAEVYGIIYSACAILYALIIPVFIGTVIYKWKKLNSLDRVRLTYIVFGLFTFLVTSLSLTIFIPYLNSDSSQLYMEKMLPFFILPFVISVLYSSYRYDFSDYKIYVNNILIYGIASILSVVWLLILHALMGNLGNNFYEFWEMSNNLTWFDLFLVTVFFGLFLKFFRSFKTEEGIGKKMQQLQEQIPFITSISNLNSYLKNKFWSILFIKDIFVSSDIGKFPLLAQFFEKHPDIELLVNDFVFWEKNKHKILHEDLSKEISQFDSLVFPLKGSDNSVRALMFIGKKRVPDAYNSEEIEQLSKFSKFLAGHLKYMEVYKQTQELNLSLDKKVDEKTIEYNNLISRQKEFIAYLGHEVRNPITNIIFLCSDIQMSVDDLKETDEIKTISSDVGVLNEELVKIANLTKSIFSTEKMDLGKIKLYRTSTLLYDFIYNEVVTIQKSHPEVQFISELENVGEYDLDEVQFREVIHNLLTNAMKYVDKEGGKILVKMTKKDTQIYINIEDNGQGLSDHEIENIFEKYATGTNDSIGLGMGLYLCKKIVELHGGNIGAKNSTTLGGACFTIKLS